MTQPPPDPTGPTGDPAHRDQQPTQPLPGVGQPASFAAETPAPSAPTPYPPAGAEQYPPAGPWGSPTGLPGQAPGVFTPPGPTAGGHVLGPQFGDTRVGLTQPLPLTGAEPTQQLPTQPPWAAVPQPGYVPPGQADAGAVPTQQLPTQQPWSAQQQPGYGPPTQVLPPDFTAQAAYGPAGYPTGGYPPGGYPPGPGGGYGPPPGYGPGGQPPQPRRSRRGPLIIGAVLGVIVVGVAAWALLRPGGLMSGQPTPQVPTPTDTATPTPLQSVTPSESPSLTPTDTPSVTETPTPSSTWTPVVGECSPELTSTECGLAKTVNRWYAVIESCVADPAESARSGIICDVRKASMLSGPTKIRIHRATSSADLSNDVQTFFTDLGYSMSKVGSNWQNPPAKTTWFYQSNKKKTLGNLLLANGQGGGHLAWTFASQHIFVQVDTPGDNVSHMMKWWSRTTF